MAKDLEITIKVSWWQLFKLKLIRLFFGRDEIKKVSLSPDDIIVYKTEMTDQQKHIVYTLMISI